MSVSPSKQSFSGELIVLRAIGTGDSPFALHSVAASWRSRLWRREQPSSMHPLPPRQSTLEGLA